MSEDEWVYTEEPAGDVCPFGHPWKANERIAELESQVARLREALEEIAARGPGTVASNRARRALGKYPDYKDGAWVAHKEETP
jgi:hypothetical protein